MNYKEYLRNQIKDANRRFLEAMANDDYKAAIVFGEIAARMEELDLKYNA